MSMKERILWLDNLKGFLILIVILGHTILFTDGTWDENIVSRFILSFWMYMFMFASGFASYKSELYLSSIKKRFIQLIIPFVAWSLVLSIFNDEHTFGEMMLYPGHSVWFLFTLFCISTINVLVCYYSRIFFVPGGLLNVLVAVLLLGISKIVKDPTLFAVSTISQYYTSYILGWYVRRYWSSINRYVNWYLFAFCSVVFIVMAYFNQGAFMPFGLPPFLHMGYDMLCGIMSIGVFVPLFIRKYDCNHLIFSSLGRCTLGMYTIHIAVYTVLFHFFHTLIIPNLNVFKYFLYVTALFLGVSSISYLIYKILGLSNISLFIFLGKRLSK